MASWIVPAASALTELTGAAMNYSGARKANKINVDLMREGWDRQERLSNTQYQRAVADYRKAGLNPILAMGHGGASSPGMSSISVENEMAGASNSARGASRAFMEAQQMRAQIANVKAQTELNKKLAESASAEASLKSVSSAKTLAEMPRSWMKNFTETAKDILPWALLLMRKGIMRF